MIEILSPVGNRDCLIAAVRSGADAVYLGTAQFNARRNAENFNGDGLKWAVAYCHTRNVKVYLTLNTLIYKNEFDSAIAEAVAADAAGVDGIICADLGLAAALKTTLPQMPLHASTQMSVHTKEALPILKSLGFSRVVPAREMSKRELIEFCEAAHKLGIEVEVFIHGALCMCMSGQCLMSAHLGGRSGNRGLCAGTCRLPFTAGGKNDYALSLKDMSHIAYINELHNMGVTSFKIEGRMKPQEYVAAATAAAKQMATNDFVEAELLELLEKIFSRSGFCDGYYTGKRNDMFGTRSDLDLSVTRLAESKLHELYRAERQSVTVDFNFYCHENTPAGLVASDRQNTVTVSGDVPEAAISRAIDNEFIKNQLSRLGGTPFIAGEITCDISNNLSLAASSIKAMRREAVEKLTALRSAVTEHETATFISKVTPSVAESQEIYAEFSNVKSIPKNLNGISGIILPADCIDQYEGDMPIIAAIPRGMRSNDYISRCFAKAKAKNVPVICHNLAAIYKAQRENLSFFAGYGLNTLNPEAAEVLYSLGAKGVTLSFEAKIADKKHFDLSHSLIYVYGKTPLMLTANCPINADMGCKGCQHKITDRKGVDFPVYCSGGYTEIYNSRPLWLADRLLEYGGFSKLILKFTDETPSEASAVIDAYLRGGSYKPQEYTRGLYDKGVL